MQDMQPLSLYVVVVSQSDTQCAEPEGFSAPKTGILPIVLLWVSLMARPGAEGALTGRQLFAPGFDVFQVEPIKCFRSDPGAWVCSYSSSKSPYLGQNMCLCRSQEDWRRPSRVFEGLIISQQLFHRVLRARDLAIGSTEFTQTGHDPMALSLRDHRTVRL